MSPSEPSSILMYSHDGNGLGHLRRNYNIACQAVKDIYCCNVLMLMGQPSIPFNSVEGIDFVKLPSMIRSHTHSWCSTTLSVPDKTLKNLRSSFIYSAAEHFNPDIFLVDFLPTGIWNELIPTLQMLKSRSPKTKIILGIRDIIDLPEIVKKEWEEEGYYDVIRKYYDNIFIYGSPKIYQTATHYGLTGDLAEKVRYCSYVSSEGPNITPQVIKENLGIQDEKMILITAGGGGDAYPMMERCMDALEILQDHLRVKAVFITGPVMSFEKRRSLERRAETLPARILSSSDHVINYMNAADLLITMGGYNTTMDVVKSNKPTLVIPRDKPKKEQLMRADLFDKLGFLKVLKPLHSLHPTEVVKHILKTIDQSPNPIIDLNLNGHVNAVEHIHQMLHSQNAERPEGEKIKITA